MAELRRVLIEPQRLAGCGQDVELTSDERHYLEKVLRLRPGSPFAIVDGREVVGEDEREDRRELHQDVERRARRVLARVADGVADDRGRVGEAVLGAGVKSADVAVTSAAETSMTAVLMCRAGAGGRASKRWRR